MLTFHHLIFMEQWYPRSYVLQDHLLLLYFLCKNHCTYNTYGKVRGNIRKLIDKLWRHMKITRKSHFFLVIIWISVSLIFFKKFKTMKINKDLKNWRSGHKWSTTHRVLKSHRSKMSIKYMLSWKQCALPVVTTMALWQLMHLDT